MSSSFLAIAHYRCFFACFFFKAPATADIYTLSLHDALPISDPGREHAQATELAPMLVRHAVVRIVASHAVRRERSEEHTSELQSQSNLVCRLLLEKKKAMTVTLIANTSCSIFS